MIIWDSWSIYHDTIDSIDCIVLPGSHGRLVYNYQFATAYTIWLDPIGNEFPILCPKLVMILIYHQGKTKW